MTVKSHICCLGLHPLELSDFDLMESSIEIENENRLVYSYGFGFHV